MTGSKLRKPNVFNINAIARKYCSLTLSRYKNIRTEIEKMEGAY